MLAARCLALKMELLFVNAVGSVILASTEGSIPESKLLCFGVNNQSYVCDSGHCCGESQCCSYYYELWWFWLVWTIIIILSCCCVCHHRRTKHRLQQQQRQHEINLIAYREAHNYASLPFYFRFLPSYLLPAYEEVENRPPTPPPPYSASQPGQPACLGSGSSEQLSDLCPAFQPVPVETACDPSGPGLGPEAPRSATALCPAPAALKPHPGVEEPGRPQQQPPALGTDSPATPSLCKQGKELHLNPVEQGSPSGSDAKDRTPGRHRRFTGDSGIEVCVCSRGAEEEEEEEEMKELKGLLDREGLEEHDFCHSCNPQGGDGGPQGHGDQERGLAGPDRGPEPRDTPPQRPHVCLHLHTINEQEGVHHGNSAEAQS